MKRILSLAGAVALATILLAQTNIMIISDPHVMDPSLFDDGPAFTSYAEGEPKLVEHSAELFDSAISIIRSSHPDIVLIPGDLTKDGERVSHDYVHTRLQTLIADGIRVFVVPGNHDILNPSARSYLGNQSASVDNITAAQFDSIYADCGYAAPVMRMPGTLSYMVYLSDDLALICMDSNQPNTTTRASAGGLDEATLLWMEQAAAKAQTEGHAVLAMMHHPITIHFLYHEKLGNTYLANTDSTLYCSNADMQSRLINAGVRGVFTGHFHIHSAQRATTDADTIYDVSTGSLCAYASPLRHITYNNGLLLSTTQNIHRYDSLAMARNTNTGKGAIRTFSSRYYTRLNAMLGDYVSDATREQMNLPASPAELTTLLTQYMLEPCTNLLNLLCAGDEHLTGTVGEQVYADILFTSYNQLVAYVFNGAESNTNLPFEDRITLKAAKAYVAEMLNDVLLSILNNRIYQESAIHPEDSFVPDCLMAFRFDIPEAQPTDVGELRVDPVTTPKGAYTLAGQKLNDSGSLEGLSSGFYVVDGKVRFVYRP